MVKEEKKTNQIEVVKVWKRREEKVAKTEKKCKEKLERIKTEMKE